MFTYRYRELAVALEKKGEVRLALAKTLRVNPEEIFNLEVERFSLDSRRKGDLHWSYNVVFDLKRKVRATGNNARGLIESKREIRSLDAEPLKDTVAMARLEQGLAVFGLRYIFCAKGSLSTFTNKVSKLKNVFATSANSL